MTKLLKILILLIPNSCMTKMKTETFISDSGWFKFEKPKEWIYKREEKGTNLFYNDNNWNGSLRITPCRFTGEEMDVQIDKVNKYVNNELNENTGAQIINLGNKEVVHYSKFIDQDGDELQIDYLVFGIKNNLFLCSFTIDKGTEKNRKVKKEMELYKNALISLEIND